MLLTLVCLLTALGYRQQQLQDTENDEPERVALAHILNPFQPTQWTVGRVGSYWPIPTGVISAKNVPDTGRTAVGCKFDKPLFPVTARQGLTTDANLGRLPGISRHEVQAKHDLRGPLV